MNGRANFAKLDGLQLERAPVLYLVTQAGVLSSLPINHYERTLYYSRLDVDGLSCAFSSRSFTGFFFSDRVL